MRITLLDKPNPVVCEIAAGMCYDAKDQHKALMHAMDGGHESVLEHCKFTFQVEGVSRALLAQLTRHRIASFSVQSQRYVPLAGGFPYVTPPRIYDLGPEYVEIYEEQMYQIAQWYDGWLVILGKEGAEDARFVLPNACCTKLVLTMNVRELRHFFALRCCKRAQWEIRLLANELLRICKEEAYILFADAGAGCVRGACPEGAKSCGKPYPLASGRKRQNVREKTLFFLYSEQRKAKIALGNAESKSGVKPEELENLRKKLDAIDLLIPLALAADESGISEQEWNDWGTDRTCDAQGRHENDGSGSNPIRAGARETVRNNQARP